MLILIKQAPSGNFGTDPNGNQVEIYDQWFFDTVAIQIVTNQLIADNATAYEMQLNQLIYDDGTNQYLYDGNGSYTVVLPPANPQYSLSVQINPSGGGTAQDLTDSGPYEEGDVVSLSASAATDYTFVNWTRNGVVISTDAALSYTMPAAAVTLVANFVADEDIPEPEPTPEAVPLPNNYYPLELRILRNGAYVQIPLPPFVQRQFSNLFDSELEGDYSYPVTIPLSPKEMISLGLPNDPQTAETFAEPIPAEVWAHGNRRYQGYLDILKADEDRVRASFILDSGFFIQSNQDLTLPSCYEASDEIDISGQTVYAVGGFELRFNYRPIRVRVNNETRNFLPSEYPDHAQMLEGIRAWLNGLGLGLDISVEYSEDPTDESSKIIYWDTTTITTCVIETLFGTSRYTRARKLTSRRFVMDPWNNSDESNRVAFPTIYNRNLYEGNNELHDGIVNRYDEQGRLYVCNIRYLSYSESFRWEHAIIPFLYLTDVVKQVFKKLGIAVSGEFFESDLIKRMLLYNNRTLDFVQVSVNGSPSRRTVVAVHQGDEDPENESHFYENVHDLVIKLGNHAPAYSVVQFLKGLKNFFGLSYDFNLLQNKVEIRFVREKLRSRVVLDLTQSAGKVYTLEHGKGLGIAYKYENPDPLMQDGNTPFEFVPDTISMAATYTVQNFGALTALDAELFETAFVQSIRAVFTLTPDQSNPPYWKLTSWRQQEETQANLKNWNLGLYPMVDVVINGRKMPGIEVTANNPEVNLTNKESGLRIMAFYGQQEDPLDRPYAFASCTRFNAKEILSLDQYDLDIRGDDIAPLHEDVNRILTRSKLYETELLLDDYTLFRLSKTPIVRIANIDYAIIEIEVQNTTKEMAVGKVKLYKVK